MPWLGVLLLIGGLYLSVVIIRGLVDFVRWLFEDWGSTPKPAENRPRRSRGPANNLRSGENLHPRTPF
jgi:hypothetical protein